jgi:hypothetical protein
LQKAEVLQEIVDPKSKFLSAIGQVQSLGSTGQTQKASNGKGLRREVYDTAHLLRANICCSLNKRRSWGRGKGEHHYSTVPVTGVLWWSEMAAGGLTAHCLRIGRDLL